MGLEIRLVIKKQQLVLLLFLPYFNVLFLYV